MAPNARATEGAHDGTTLYFCTGGLHEEGLYVAAESRGKAKRMYCDYECVCDFDMVHTHIISCDFDGPAGVYDENEEE